MNAAQKIPACFFPLTTEEASREYDCLARTLSDAGRLTLAMHRALSSYVLQADTILKAREEGSQIRASWFATLDKARSQLKLEELEDPTPPRDQAAPQPNKFADCGFASRLSHRSPSSSGDPYSSCPAVAVEGRSPAPGPRRRFRAR